MALPKLNLRDLFWLVLVAAMGCGWWLDRDAQQKRLTTLEADLAATLDRRVSLEELMHIMTRLGSNERGMSPQRIKAILDASTEDAAETKGQADREIRTTSRKLLAPAPLQPVASPPARH